jgi:hypothetical protein
VETLTQAGLLKVICGTDTLGVGINVPIRTVLFTALSKYDGTRARLLQAREFHQIAGRAGRAGFDSAGAVVVQAPEHVVENERALAKAGDDPKKRRKVVRKKPPDRLVSWGRPTFERLVAAEPEPLQSSFVVSHAMLLGVIGRPGDAFAAMKHLLTDNDEAPAAQRRHIRRAFAIYRALLAGGVVERLGEPDEQGRRWRLTVDLQDSRCHRWRWPPSGCWTGTHLGTRWTSCRSSRPPWTTRASCWRRRPTRRAARPSGR